VSSASLPLADEEWSESRDTLHAGAREAGRLALARLDASQQIDENEEPSAPTRGTNGASRTGTPPMASTRSSATHHSQTWRPPASREFQEALPRGRHSFDDLPGKWQAAILKAEQNRPKLRVLSSE